ncbi:aldo/keto reductase [Corynebacterium ulceribovis]|uniref:aldo/keto reductase n=1 Tax=Corynebacterium ulceribovis TaxID=487732 RepID=UPI000476D0CE|nr:aldo/keto reductase [Corynebacterium ulceribovis]
MEHRQVGRSGLRVSRLGLGADRWGVDVSLETAENIARQFLDAGGSLLEASQPDTYGVADDMLATVLSQLPRDEICLSAVSGVDPRKPVGRRVDCSRRNLIRQLDERLRALGTDYLDLWSVAWWDMRTPPEEVADTLVGAVRAGKVRYVGARGYRGWQLAVTEGLVAASASYSLLNRDVEDEVLPAAAHLGLGFLAGRALAQGVLSGKYREQVPTDSRGADPVGGAEVLDRLDHRSDTVLDALQLAADGLGIAPSTAALSWVQEQPGVTAAIISVRNEQQLDEALATADVRLPKAIGEALADVSALRLH